MKSHDQFKSELMQVKPWLVLNSVYKSECQKVTVTCSKCGKVSHSLPKDLLKPSRCMGCILKDNKLKSMSKLKELEPDIILVGEFVNQNTNTEFKCGKCGHIWKVSPKHILNDDTGCPRCAGRITRYTHEDIVKLFPDIVLLEPFKSLNSEILVRFKECGHTHRVRISNLLRRETNGCKTCRNINATKTHEQFVEEVLKVNPKIQLLGRYVNNSTQILTKCLDCGCVKLRYPKSLISGNGCKSCNDLHKTMKFEVFLSSFRALNPFDYEEYTFDKDSYRGCRYDIKITHSCGHMYLAKGDKLLSGYGRCPNCKNTLSNGASVVRDYLVRNKYKFNSEVTYDDLKTETGQHLRFDFVVKITDSLIVVIEYNGFQHYSPYNTFHYTLEDFEYQVYRDSIKKLYALKHNFYYLEVPCYIPFNKIPEFLDFYLEKAKTSRILNLIPNPIIELLNRHTSKELPVLAYGKWCLCDGDIKLLNSNNLTDESEILLANRYGEISKLTVKEYLRLKK